MVFLYPQSYRVENPAIIAELPYRAAFGGPQKWSPEGCMPILMVLGAGNPKSGFADPAAEHYTVSPPVGGIVLQEILPSCQEKLQDAQGLTNLVGEIGSQPGFSRLAALISYKLGGYETFLGTAAAFSKDKDGQRKLSAGQTWIVSVAMRYHGMIFLWTVTANDSGLLNDLLGGRVQFGTDPPWALVPFRMTPRDKTNSQDAVPLQ